LPEETLPPILVTNPRSDEEFRALAQAIVDAGVPSPEALEQRLRERYPLSTVHSRELSDEPTAIWYVYRDGRWIG
jgi:hypothetical protein